MKHYGDVSKINGSKVDPVDVITFGSPCQDLSVAGKRAGIQDGERSNLFFEAVRIIKEMREATNGEYPKYAVWENVPGAFSSNKGHDFKAVLEAICSVCDDAVSIPEPYDNKRTKLVWNKAGEIVGNNYSIAWRTLDAQYWGVPQRRKRIYLVADFTGGCAREVLFKQESLRGYFTQSRTAGQDSTRNVAGSIDGGCGVECVKILTMATQQGGAEICENLCPTITAAAGMSGNNQPAIALQANGIDRADTAGCNGKGWREDESYTLNTIDRHAVCYPLNEQIILRHGALGRNTGFGAGEDGAPAYTLQANHPHAVCYQDQVGALQARDYKGIGSQYVGEDKLVVECYDARGNGDGGLVPTLTGDHQNSITDYTAAAVYEPKSALEENWAETQVKNALRAGASKSSHAVVQEVKPPRKYIIRRLTPTECARLQGFPDWWSNLAPYNPDDADFWEDVRKTHAEINGKNYRPVKDLEKWYNKLHTDSAEYKMWGNGIALPNAEYVLHGIAEQGAKTLGSLFDGSGGFPLAGVLNGIKPVWASEVELYPIAVTKSRFGGMT